MTHRGFSNHKWKVGETVWGLSAFNLTDDEKLSFYRVIKLTVSTITYTKSEQREYLEGIFFRPPSPSELKEGEDVSMFMKKIDGFHDWRLLQERIFLTKKEAQQFMEEHRIGSVIVIGNNLINRKKELDLKIKELKKKTKELEAATKRLNKLTAEIKSQSYA